jgi:hypothetical protein
MRAVLLWSLAFLATWVVLATLAIVVLRWRLQRANRVSPGVRSPAPTSWLWVPSQPARLHRRLRAAVREVALPPARRRDALGAGLTVEELRRELTQQAVELDHHLVLAARHTRTRRRTVLVELDGHVTQVEQLSLRLTRLSRSPGSPASGWDSPALPVALDQLGRHLDLLDEARAELTLIERAAGLTGPDPLPSPAMISRQPPRPPA